MKAFYLLIVALLAVTAGSSLADDITTLDGKQYQDVRDVVAKHNGLFFVSGSGNSVKGVTVPFDNLSDDTKDKYHCDPFALGLAYARQNVEVNLTKKLAFSLDQLDAAKKKAKAEKKMIGFIMEWDTFMVPARPLLRGSEAGLAHFYDVFNDALVLVFVRHESELNNVPDAVKLGFFGPEEGGFAPNMAVVTADCSDFVCEIPYGGDHSNGAIREKIFKDKIAVIKIYIKEHADK
jgi:hypothetical protein